LPAADRLARGKTEPRATPICIWQEAAGTPDQQEADGTPDQQESAGTPDRAKRHACRPPSAAARAESRRGRAVT
jgi:hypothetical protein